MAELIIIHPSGSVVLTERENEPTLKELQTAVGGYIEHVNVIYRGKPVHAYVNEDGKRLRLPTNKKATALYHNSLQGPEDKTYEEYKNLNDDPSDFIYYGADHIVGTMVVWTGDVS